ncbi:hypothetical protein EKO04_008870 [Ascochyta lentis]|uniref:Uncharacterized protein n=1 Tax=Ascochyta lentis TaxID=205686 RepID=A0A8H7IV85_9PLEO|nr:hypothetical protein EKO04_008870 [Ascochyta lentis]
MKEFDMPREWAAEHARRANTDSSKLRPAAFPSLPLDQPLSNTSPEETPEETPEESSEETHGDTSEATLEETPEIDPDLIQTSPDTVAADLATETANPTHSSSPNVINHIQTLAISFHCGTYTLGTGELDDQVLQAYNDMLETGVLSTSPPTRQRERRTSNSISFHKTKLLARKAALETELQYLHRKYNIVPSAPLPPSPVSLSPTAADPKPADPDTADLELLKQQIKHLDSEIWKLKSQTRHVVKARTRFHGAQPTSALSRSAPVETPAPSPFKEMWCETDGVKSLSQRWSESGGGREGEVLEAVQPDRGNAVVAGDEVSFEVEGEEGRAAHWVGGGALNALLPPWEEVDEGSAQ